MADEKNPFLLFVIKTKRGTGKREEDKTVNHPNLGTLQKILAESRHCSVNQSN